MPCLVAFSIATAACLPLPTSAETVAMPVSFGSVAALRAAEPAAEISYGSDALQTVLRFDPVGTNPVDIALIHGGCWSADYDRQHILPLAGALRDSGYRVWVPEYRRVGDVGGGWPGTWEDIESVLNRIAADVGHRRVVAVGHSAGGHLALLAATRPASPLLGSIGLAPITDLGAYAAGEGSCQSMASRLMGGSPEDNPDAFAAASPAGKAAVVPAIVVQGEADPIVPMSQARGMADAQLVTVPEAGHFDLIHPGTAAYGILLGQLQAIEAAAVTGERGR